MNRLFGRSKDNKTHQPKEKPQINNQKRQHSGRSKAQQTSSLPKRQFGKIIRRNPLNKKSTQQPVQGKIAYDQRQVENLLHKVYHLDTNAENYIDFKPKWTKFKQAIGNNFKVVGFEIRPISQVGNQAIKCGRFISKYCQLISRNNYASPTITFRTYYQKYKDGITRNKSDFNQFFKVFLKQQQQRENQANKKPKINIGAKINLKRQLEPKLKNQTGVDDYPKLGQYQPISTSHKPSLFSKEAQEKRNILPVEQKDSEKKQTKAASKSPRNKKEQKQTQHKKIDYKIQYILDYFEINDIYTLNEVQIEGLLQNFEGTYAIFFAKEKKTNKQATMIGIIKQKQNYDEDKMILKKIDSNYENLCFLDLEGKTLQQVWADN